MGGNEQNEGAKQAFQACQGFQGCYKREGRAKGKIGYQAFQGCWGSKGSPKWDGERGQLKDRDARNSLRRLSEQCQLKDAGRVIDENP